MAALAAVNTPPPTPQQQIAPAQSPSRQPDLLQKLAVARLKHTVSELEDKVEFDRRNNPLPPPKPTTLHLVPDASAFTTSITDIKGYVAEESAKVTVPLCVLDALDALKRGSENENVNARETVRWFDRTIGKGNIEKGVKVQAPGELYGRWEECLEWYNPLTTGADGDEISFTSPLAMTESQMLAQASEGLNDLSLSPSPPGSPIIATANTPSMPPRILKSANTFHIAGSGAPKQQISLPRSSTLPLQDPPSPTSSLHAPDVPRKVQPIINCALEILHSEKTEFSKKSEGVFFLVTNNPETFHWAKSFGIPALNTKELAGKIAEEKRLYKAKKRDYEHMHSPKAPVLDANEFRNRDLHKSPKNTFSQPHFQGGRGGSAVSGRQNTSQNGGFNDSSHQPRRRNRNNQNARGGAANGNSGGGANRGGRGGSRGGHSENLARNNAATLQEKTQSGNVYSTSPTQHHSYQNSNRGPQHILGRGQPDTEPEYVLGRGANRGVARGKGKLWVP